MRKDNSVGVRVSGLMRDYLVYYGVPYGRAVKASQQFDQTLLTAPWLETYNGTTFEKAYVPEVQL